MSNLKETREESRVVAGSCKLGTRIRVQPYLERTHYNQILTLLDLWRKYINPDETESHFIARIIEKGIPEMNQEVARLIGKSITELTKELSESRGTT